MKVQELNAEISLIFEERREIESWIISEKQELIEAHRGQLLKAHYAIADQFIAVCPLLIMGVGVTNPSHAISRGVFFARDVKELEPVFLANGAFFTGCLGVDIFQSRTELADLVSSDDISEQLTLWDQANGLLVYNTI